jgi:hypothetical protein
MPTPSLFANGRDVEALGLRVFTCKGPWDIPQITDPTLVIPGRLGLVRTGAATQMAARTITLTGAIYRSDAPRTNADVLAMLDVLKPLLALGVLELRTATQPTRSYLCRLATFDVTMHGAAFAAGSADFSLTLTCTDPLGYDTDPSGIGFAAAPIAIPLGTGPSAGLLRIMGPATSPVVTYRDLTGAIVHTLGFTRTLLATDYEEIDLDLLKVTRVQSGVATNDIAALTSGDLEDFVLRPEDGDALAGVYPTLECSGLTGTGNQCELLYSRGWL